MKTRIIITLFALLILPATILAQTEVSVFDNDINAGDVVYWTSDNIYVLEEMVFVEDGAKLYIEPGTVIWGKEGQEDEAKALVITRGAQIFAEGTPDKPIIFTAYGDDPYDLTDGFGLDQSGLWGGLILLGTAPTNNVASGYVKNIEGIVETEIRGKYGAPPAEWDVNDNSGVVRYVSIRHGGTDIGDGNEINGLTMGAVGRGTTIEFVEVWYNNDDGFEWFGGNVNSRYLVSAFNKDDSFDYDEGWNGRGQFWFSIQAETRGNMGGEHDGGNSPDDSEPYAKPVIMNATYIGSGTGSGNTSSKILHFRDNAGGTYCNSIFAETGGYGLEIEDLESGDPNSAVEDSRKRLETGDLKINNNIWWKIGAETTTVDGISPDVEDYPQQFVRDYLSDAANNNWIEDPMFGGVSRDLMNPDGMLDPRPDYNSPAFTRATCSIPDDEQSMNFFHEVDYIGAFGPGDLWLDRWTYLSYSGVLMQTMQNEVSVFDNDINAGETVRWTNDNIYVLEEMVFVEEGAELWIEPGTVIWGKEGQEDEAKALVITRGAKIYAMGTSTQPIIFTAYGDDPYDFTDGFGLDQSGLWGGLILLGRGPTNNVASGYVKNIEGIVETETRGKYGAPPSEWDPMDNSGIVRHVSIRHGGTDIGDGNEINGLTMGAVGAGTTIEYVEVWYNNDDGFEWFGGNVNTRFLVSAFNKDDSFDYDEGFNGKGQFWFSIQAPTRGNNGGEHDGGNSPDDSEPYAIPYIYNATFIGSGVNSGNSSSQILHFRDNAGGKYFNSIFMETGGKGLDIEDLESGDPNSAVQDSRKRLEAGDLVLMNNIWWKIGSQNTTVDDIAPDADDYPEQFVRDYIGNPDNGNVIMNPMLRGIERLSSEEFPMGGLDPRPQVNSPAFTNPKHAFYHREGEGSNDFFIVAPYIGAFGEKSWIADWTYLSFTDVTKGMGGGYPAMEIAPSQEDALTVEEEFISEAGSGITNYPNPFEESTEIQFYVGGYNSVNLSIYNVMGQKVAELVNKPLVAGLYGVNWTVSDQPAGVYIVKLQIGNKVSSHKLILK